MRRQKRNRVSCEGVGAVEHRTGGCRFRITSLMPCNITSGVSAFVSVLRVESRITQSTAIVCERSALRTAKQRAYIRAIVTAGRTAHGRAGPLAPRVRSTGRCVQHLGQHELIQPLPHAARAALGSDAAIPRLTDSGFSARVGSVCPAHVTDAHASPAQDRSALLVVALGTRQHAVRLAQAFSDSGRGSLYDIILGAHATRRQGVQWPSTKSSELRTNATRLQGSRYLYGLQPMNPFACSQGWLLPAPESVIARLTIAQQIYIAYVDMPRGDMLECAAPAV